MIQQALEDLGFNSENVSFYISNKKVDIDKAIVSKIQISDNIVNEKRRSEFIRGRFCAHMAILNQFNKRVYDIKSANDRVPIWPENVVGSLTHSEYYAGAVVASQEAMLGVGLDIENISRLKDEISKMIIFDSDVKRPNELTQQEYLALIFSAKESLYKALYPQVKKFFGFKAAALKSVDVKDKSFEIELIESLSDEISPQSLGVLRGRFLIIDCHILTSILIPV